MDTERRHPLAALADPAAWQRRLTAAGQWAALQLRRPRTRLALVGVILLLLAGFGIVASMWTLPLMVIGAVMVVVAWIGGRLDGRFAVTWGESGTQLEFRAEIKAPEHPEVLPASRRSALSGSRPALEELAVIEGEGHTVEINVADLRALITAAEAAEAPAAADAAHAADAADAAKPGR